MKTIEISVIIPACNEEKYIMKTISSVKDQFFKDYEIIVVCDGCTDNTEKVISNKVDRVISLTERTGPANAKNIGASRASGKIFIFLDADTLVSKKTLLKIKDSIKENVVGTCKIKPDSNKPRHKLFYSLKNIFVTPFGVSNGIIFCTKNTFIKYKGFDYLLQKAEDGTFIRKIKRRGKFLVLNDYVTSSVRRFEKLGYISVLLYWTKEFILTSKNKYPVIR